MTPTGPRRASVEASRCVRVDTREPGVLSCRWLEARSSSSITGRPAPSLRPAGSIPGTARGVSPAKSSDDAAASENPAFEIVLTMAALREGALIRTSSRCVSLTPLVEAKPSA